MEYDESVLVKRVDDAKPVSRAGGGQQMTLHCAQCSSILGDSSGICGELSGPDAIMCLRVTNDVVIDDAVVSGHKGELANCIYSSLKCRGCCSAVGKVVHSAPSRLATIRSLFLLHKANISCYILDSRSMVNSSTITFDLTPLRQNLNEVRQQFEARLDYMLRVKSRLVENSVNTELDK